MKSTTAILLLACICAPARSQEPWSTYRGNPQRTGNTDGIAGPAAPKILWVFKSQDHFIASPVPAGDQLLVSGLGAFNRPALMSLPLKSKASAEPTWTKSTPYLKLPVVSSPAVLGDKIVFGDGMHQTDGAVLHCLPAKGGLPVWSYAIPGELVHLEGAPSIAGTKVAIGAGSAGVVCLDSSRLSLDGKDFTAEAAQSEMAAHWKGLLAKYEVDKKKDPDFAIPPGEDSLLKFSPKLLWQAGRGKWHVDAPVNAVGGKIVVASAFLDKEKVGDRAVHCLDADTGEAVWRTPLTHNPWGGASIVDGTAVVGTSTISFDTKLVKGAKGEVLAIDMKDGSVRWKKEFPGGILGCVAATKDVAVFACTDGKVRALALRDGERRWIYDAKMTIFASPAIAGDTVYVGDLKGVIHAIDLKGGNGKWTLDLGTHAATRAPGMIYGGISIADGKLFVATSNLEGPFARQPTVVVCIGAE